MERREFLKYSAAAASIVVVPATYGSTKKSKTLFLNAEAVREHRDAGILNSYSFINGEHGLADTLSTEDSLKFIGAISDSPIVVSHNGQMFFRFPPRTAMISDCKWSRNPSGCGFMLTEIGITVAPIDREISCDVQLKELYPRWRLA